MKINRLVILFSSCIVAVPVWAQNSVTLYGIVDVGVQAVNHVPTVNGQGGTAFSLTSGGAQTSRWGLRVKEDLGGGYGVIAVLEDGFDATKGTLNNGGRLWGRSSYVGFTSQYGIFTLGRQVTAIYDFDLAYDPVGPALYSSPAYDAAFVSRADNSVKYVDDVSLAGGKLSLDALYSFGYDSVTGVGPVAGDYRVGKEESLFINYQRSVVSVGLLFDQQNGNTIAAQDNKVQRFGAAAQVDLSPVQLYAAYRFLAQKHAAQNRYSSLYWLGAKYLVTPAFNVSSDLLYQQDRNTGQGNPVMLSAIGSYLLSKSTDVYLEAATVLNKKHTNLGVNGFGTSTTGEVQTGVLVGLRTRF
ncbi:porin [Paraburkholderia elongata]|uniref:Porin n=1 Tax=Paraburkholderia elongata TaxID=2675747 RepID=A0A972NP28_9BURK|nr:porin [Paraburkholderia elongata]NPT55085.1 porin [Paraburkholderia elongata]